MDRFGFWGVGRVVDKAGMGRVLLGERGVEKRIYIIKVENGCGIGVNWADFQVLDWVVK